MRRIVLSCCLACLALVLAACSSTVATPRPVAGHVAPTTPSPGPARYPVSVDVVSPSFTAVLVDIAPQSSRDTVRLIGSADQERTFRPIGPRVPIATHGDRVFFLNRTDGWFTVALDGDATDLLYRTTDGGRTWRHTRVPGHSASWPAYDQVLFSDPQHGWIAAVSGTGPVESLLHSWDGGRTWHPVPLDASAARELGDLSVGGGLLWKSGWYVAPSVSSDGGRTWRRAAPNVSRFLTGDVAAFGRLAIAALSVRHCRSCTSAAPVRVYTSADGGRSWRRLSTLGTRLGRGTSGPVSASFPTPRIGWIVGTDPAGRLRAFRSVGLRSWRSVAAPVAGDAVVTVDAASARQAWLIASPRRGNGTPQVFVTRDSGRSWHRVRP